MNAKIWLATLGWLAVTSLGAAQTGDSREVVEKILINWRETKLLGDDQLMRIKGLGDRALPVLATFLADKDLSAFAESAMTEIDATGAGRYLILELPRRDPALHREALKSANRLVREYELFTVAGRPKPNPTQPPARWPASTTPYPYKKELHRAALALAFADETRDTQVEIVQTIGLTGNRRDIPLLKRMKARFGYLGWLCVAAEARLGDRDALKEIADSLRKSVDPRPAQPTFSVDRLRHDPTPGAVVASREDGERMRTAAFQAAFTMNRQFIPLLLAHLGDPPGQRHGDYSDPSPAGEAMDALSTIVLGKTYSSYSVEDWKRWQENQRNPDHRRTLLN